MQYRFASLLAAGALIAVGNGAPLPQQLSDTPSTIDLNKPSTEVTWGKRDLTFGQPANTIELGKPSTEVTWC